MSQTLGVQFVACTMSMDVMGITKEELMDGLEYAGVATYLSHAEESNVKSFYMRLPGTLEEKVEPMKKG